jgi:two-component sensor histidine kinase
MALLREVHHRVKNNLQVIASIMRLQARRTSSPEARGLLEESVNRILSVAVVHEFLSQNAKGTIGLREVAHRIIGQVERGLVAPDKSIRLSVRGPEIWLPAERATQCALVINELVQNAIEHGMALRDSGAIDVELVDHGDSVSIIIADDGEGLPEGFDLDTSAHLGLQIVRSMVERDLRGKFWLTPEPTGTRARLRIAKTA